jgi:hypothetical protein
MKTLNFYANARSTIGEDRALGGFFLQTALALGAAALLLNTSLHGCA